MNIFVQDESKNPFGTWKDRRSKYILQKAQREGVLKLCLITSGNAGYSLAQHARTVGIKVTCIVDRNLKEHIKDELKKVAYQVKEVNLNGKILKPEDVIALARESDTESIWDVTNGYAAAYTSIARDFEGESPDYVICPVGSGEAFVGIYQGLHESGSKAVLVGVGVESHPSFADKLSTPWTPYQQKMDQIVAAGHKLLRLTESEVHAVYEENKDEYASEPSAAVVWAGLKKLGLPERANVVIVNSGKGLF